MKVSQRGIAIASKPVHGRQACTFPSICVLPGGRWLCAARATPAKASDDDQSVLLAWSDNEGATWSDPVVPFTPPPVEGRTGLFRAGYVTPLPPATLPRPLGESGLRAGGGSDVLIALAWVDRSDPSLPFFNEKTEGLLDMRIFLSRSSDAGQTWSELELVPNDPFNCPMPITGPVLVLPDGTWVCHFELNKHYNDPVPWRHSSVMLFSKDCGKTWPRHFKVSDDPTARLFYWDQRPAVLKDGRLLDLFWTFDRKTAKYLNIHARESADGGVTWSALWDTGVAGQPSAPVSLPDGRVLMALVDRSGAPKIKWRVSRDGGRTWPVRTEGVLYESQTSSQSINKGSMQDAWKEMAGYSVGLPATAALPDGDVLVVYYAGPSTTEISIEWARLRG